MRKNFKFIVFTAAVFAAVVCYAGGASYASEVSLNAAVNPEKANVGAPLAYTLSISGIDPASIRITLPEKKVVYPDKNESAESDSKKNKNKPGEGENSPDEFVPLYIINSATRDDSGPGGEKQVNIKIQLSYYRPGIYVLPEIKIAGSDGVTISYRIPSVTIEESNKEGKLEDIEPPVSLSGNYTRIIWLIAAVLLAIAAAAAVYYYLKKRKKPAEPEAPPVPPIEIFLSEVESLKLRELIDQGKVNEYVFGISIIFRRYLSSMLMFDAAEMTTDEIASRIKRYMPGEMYQICGEMILSNMRLWDFSKFAEFAPSTELLLDNLEATVSTAKKISAMTEAAKENAVNERGDNGTLRV